VDQHFDAIMRELLREAGGRLWRSRQAAGAALCELLSGRRWKQVAPFYEQASRRAAVRARGRRGSMAARAYNRLGPDLT
jgi:hypothetical protein